MDYEKTIEEVLEGFQADANRRIAEIQKRIKEGSGTYGDALHLASRSGRAAGKAIGDALVENAVSGAADSELTQLLVPAVLKENYKTVTAATEQVQTSLNQKAGIHLKALVPKFNQDRSDGLVTEILGKEDIQAFAPTLTQQVENASMGIVDDSVRQNAGFHYRVGLSPKIVRTAEHKCCEWCDNLAGTYSYPCDSEVYRRHDNCRCVVEYDPGNGKIQNAHTKQIYTSDSARYRRISQDESLKHNPFKSVDVALQYRQDSTPGRGNIDYQDGYDLESHRQEIKMADFLHKTFGGDIELLTESNVPNVKTADYIWNGSYWDLKSVTTEKAANSAIRYGLKQIYANPGGIILDYQNHKIDYAKLKRVIDTRMGYSQSESIDIMIVQKNRVIAILRY